MQIHELSRVLSITLVQLGDRPVIPWPVTFLSIQPAKQSKAVSYQVSLNIKKKKKKHKTHFIFTLTIIRYQSQGKYEWISVCWALVMLFKFFILNELHFFLWFLTDFHSLKQKQSYLQVQCHFHLLHTVSFQLSQKSSYQGFGESISFPRVVGCVFNAQISPDVPLFNCCCRTLRSHWYFMSSY